MKEVLLLKHAVGGRTFVHTGHRPVPYTVDPDGDGWLIRVEMPFEPAIEELLKWKQELNLFVFREFEDRPTLKIWFYVNGDQVHYDEAAGCLTIGATSRIEYVPAEFDYQ